MNIETTSQVSQFLTLQAKTELELRAICEGLKIEPNGSREDMIQALMSLGINEQKSVLLAQAIPLRTKDNNHQPIQAAIDAMRQWRKLIFEGKDNKKVFNLVNNKGKTYTLTLKYIKCSNEVLKEILENGWYLPLEQNRDLIYVLKTNPDKFDVSIIQKPDASGNSWLMLHCQPKKAA